MAVADSPANGEQKKFLEALTAALVIVHDQGPDVLCTDFTHLMDSIIRVFDYLGALMHFAKPDLLAKNESLKVASKQFKTLRELVDADRAAGTLTVKNSNARNLHRMKCVVNFLSLLFGNLLASPDVPSCRPACTAAYNTALAPIHTYVVQTAVWAAFYAVPSRVDFLSSIGETEESAKEHAQDIMRWGQPLVEELDRLIGTPMPASDKTWI